VVTVTQDFDLYVVQDTHDFGFYVVQQVQ